MRYRLYYRSKHFTKNELLSRHVRGVDLSDAMYSFRCRHADKYIIDVDATKRNEMELLLSC